MAHALQSPPADMDPRSDQTPAHSSVSSALAVDPGARLPFPVILLWLCAFAGLVVYTASFYVPSLAQLGK